MYSKQVQTSSPSPSSNRLLRGSPSNTIRIVVDGMDKKFAISTASDGGTSGDDIPDFTNTTALGLKLGGTAIPGLLDVRLDNVRVRE